MSNTAKIIYFSSRIDTYVDAITALLIEYPDIETIQIVFTSWSYPEQDNQITPPSVGAEQEKFLYKIRERLETVSEKIEVYKKAENVSLKAEQLKSSLSFLFDSCKIIDVSALPKEFAINILSLALMKKSIAIYSLRWTGKLNKERANRISVDNYIYEDLTNMYGTKKLRRSYLSNKIFIYIIGISIFILGVLQCVSYWYPNFKIATNILNSFGLLIGVASLYLATRKV